MSLLRRKHRRMPELNTTSTADISFMLLTFFLVTTSMDSDRGLARRLPPPALAEEERQEVSVGRADVVNVALDANDRLTLDGKEATLAQVRQRVTTLAMAKPTQHVVSVKADDQTSYDAYFKLQNAIVAAYNALRDRQARRSFGHPYAECDQDERAVIAKKYPQRISEAEPDEEKGERQ